MRPEKSGIDGAWNLINSQSGEPLPLPAPLANPAIVIDSNGISKIFGSTASILPRRPGVYLLKVSLPDRKQEALHRYLDVKARTGTAELHLLPNGQLELVSKGGNLSLVFGRAGG